VKFTNKQKYIFKKRYIILELTRKTDFRLFAINLQNIDTLFKTVGQNKEVTYSPAIHRGIREFIFQNNGTRNSILHYYKSINSI